MVVGGIKKIGGIEVETLSLLIKARSKFCVLQLMVRYVK